MPKQSKPVPNCIYIARRKASLTQRELAMLIGYVNEGGVLVFLGLIHRQYALDECEECEECDEWEECDECCAIILKLSRCCFRMSFGGSVLSAASDDEEMAVVPGWGRTTATGKAFAPVATIALPTRTANLPAMPLRNVFLSSCMSVPRFKEC